MHTALLPVNLIRSLAAVAAGVLVAGHAAAQYPSKPIRILLPFPAGGVVDTVTRIITQPLSQSLGQTIVIEAKPGADGQIAAMEARKSAPDGYTLFLGTTTSMSMVPALRKNPPYNPIADFTPISHMGAGAFFVFVHSDVPASSLEQLVSHARANPGKVAYASGTAFAIAATAHFMQHAKIQMLHVPYKGEVAALPDFITGRIQVMFATPSLIMQHIKDGKLRALAVLLPQRSGLLPNVPTMLELGYPEVPVTSWSGFFGPANLPPEITERLSREINAILARTSVREELDGRGIMAHGTSPDALRQVVKSQLDAWHRAVRDGWVRQE